MNQYLNNIAIGFFLGVCVMAASVVALTVLYFSQPRTKKRTNNKAAKPPLKSKTSPAKNRTGSTVNRIGLKIRHLLPWLRTFIQGLKPLLKDKWFIKRSGKSSGAMPDKKEIAAKKGANKGLDLKKTPSKVKAPPAKSDILPDSWPEQETIKPENPAPAVKAEASQAEIKPAIPEPPVQPIPEPKIASSIEAAQEAKPAAAPAPEVNPPILIKITNMPQAPVEPVVDISAEKEKPDMEAKKEIEVKEAKTEANAASTVSPAHPSDEAAGKSQPETKTQPANPSSDFSDLFTEEDFEDSEVSKLARELNDLETDDILEESRNLISQFKRGKN